MLYNAIQTVEQNVRRPFSSFVLDTSENAKHLLPVVLGFRLVGKRTFYLLGRPFRE
jgi:hypothetical protein